MDRIREWMERNPEEGKELRRRNKSYVFFRETHLPGNEEPIGAQGISLTPGRSIAVDRKLHTYGTPFFISAYLPIEGLKPDTWFRRLMIAQDTGGAIVGPARADLYFGAGDEAASVAGRLRHDGRFVMLAPKELVPVGPDDEIPLPRPRPTIEEMAAYEKIAAKEEAEAKSETDKPEFQTGGQGAGGAPPRPRSPPRKPTRNRTRPRRRSPRAKSRESRRRKKPATKRQEGAKPRAKSDAKPGAKSDAKSETKSKTKSGPGTTPRHEQAAAERRRARPVEGRHPFDRAVAEGFTR